ncbi:MAG: hypothetical protein FH748_02735 [Balneolaceae bacterium]|nr:hypothetical protein [Balneolaceae bacterium]
MVSAEKLNLLEVQALSSSSRKQLYMITYQDRHFEVSKPVVDLVELLKNNNSLEEVSHVFSSKNGREYSCERIEGLIDTYINPIFDGEQQETNSYIWLRREFISGKTLRPLTNVLSAFFKPFVAFCITAAVIAAQGYFFLFTGTEAVAVESFGLGTFFLVGAPFFLSVIFHELGHASACRYYGVQHGHIGVGLYLHFPVFYADVSNVWKLNRKERIVVDFAGIYFQLIFLVLVILLYGITQDANLKYVVYAINLSFLFDLNPFFRFDGYWVFTDLLGVANLRKRTYEVIAYCSKKIRGKKVSEKPYLFQINRREKYAFMMYVVISNLFFGYYILYRMPLFLYHFVATIPGDFALLIEGMNTGEAFPFEVLGTILMQLVFIMLTLYILYRVGSRIYKYAVAKAS